jgi:hypothetical protein
LGGSTSYAIVEGTSMEPTLRDGDLALVRARASYGRDEIVAFRVPSGDPGAGAIVIHRVVGRTTDGLVMQGDNKDGPDPWTPADGDVLGAMWLRVPRGGGFVAAVSTPLGAATLMSALVFVSVAAGGRLRRAVPASSALFRLLLVIGLAGAPIASAAALTVEPATLALFILPPPGAPSISASVVIQPQSLQKRSQGNPVSATVEFPLGVDPGDVDTSTLRLCLGTGPCGTSGVAPTRVRLGDADGDGTPDLRATFSRAAVIALVQDIQPPATVTFTVSGVVGVVPFAGSDDVRLVDPSDTQTGSEEASPPSPSPSPPSPTPDASPPADPSPSPPPPSPSPSIDPSPAPG